MARIAQYDVFNSNASKASRACLRVRMEGVIMAELKCEHSNPLKYVRTHPLSEDRKEFVRQLKANGIEDSEIQMLLKLPTKV